MDEVKNLLPSSDGEPGAPQVAASEACLPGLDIEQ
jgi:hypothetical protein